MFRKSEQRTANEIVNKMQGQNKFLVTEKTKIKVVYISKM